MFGIQRRKVNWILDADYRNFFDTVSHDWLLRFLKLRIGDERMLRLICKWLKVGVLENEAVTESELGTPQGATISPLMANTFLHYVFDLWAHQWRKRHARGDMIIVRYADDTALGFEHEADARRFLVDMKVRAEAFGLSLHPDKTRIIRFGRFAASNRKERGLGKPETFNFLGFTLICGTKRTGGFQLLRKTRRDRMQATLQRVKEELRRKRHEAIPLQGKWLAQVIRGFNAYHAVPTNYRSLVLFRVRVTQLWKRALMRRGQRSAVPWQRMDALRDRYLPPPRILHPWPERRFAVTHPRWEPCA
jgi:RNA-directed DNA polymerase